MIVKIKGDLIQYPVTEIVLQKNYVDPEAITLLYCLSCGRSLAQYTGLMFRVIEEGTPPKFIAGQPQIILYCHLCKRRYLINNLF